MVPVRKAANRIFRASGVVYKPDPKPEKPAMDKLSRERQAWSSEAIRGGHASGEEGMLLPPTRRDARPNLPLVHHAADLEDVKTLLEELSA
jgi:hypothetical protein